MKHVLSQGYLDLLCGIYSLMNAARIVSDDFTIGKAQVAFSEALKFLEHKGSLYHVLTNGIGYSDLTAIFDTVVAPTFHLQRDTPFRKREKVSVPAFWHEVGDFLKADPHHSVLILFENRYWVHWTVVREVTPKTLVLADSARRSFLHSAYLTTSRKEIGSTRIYVRPTLFISRKKIDLA